MIQSCSFFTCCNLKMKKRSHTSAVREGSRGLRREVWWQRLTRRARQGTASGVSGAGATGEQDSGDGGSRLSELRGGPPCFPGASRDQDVRGLGSTPRVRPNQQHNRVQAASKAFRLGELGARSRIQPSEAL